MATDKKHIAVYLDKDNEDSLNQYVATNGGIKYSAAVNQILSAFFGNKTSPSLSNTPVTDNLEEIIEAKLAEALQGSRPSDILSDGLPEKVAALETRLDDLGNIPSDTPSDILERMAALEETINTLSNRPSDTPDFDQLIEAAIAKQMTESLGES